MTDRYANYSERLILYRPLGITVYNIFQYK